MTRHDFIAAYWPLHDKLYSAPNATVRVAIWRRLGNLTRMYQAQFSTHEHITIDATIAPPELLPSRIVPFPAANWQPR